ncbi:MAG: chalcone isomerase family protein [Micropepsaceae bacterium]
MRRVLIACVAVLGLAGAALAMTRPLELGSTINATKPYGSGSLTWLVFTAYDATLWTDAPQWSMSAPFALTLRYRMGFTTGELVERTVEEMAKVSPATPKDALARNSAALSQAFPAVKDGDRITAMYVPGQGTRFFHNGAPTANIADSGFADPFFGIWLSPKTSEPKLRAGLLRLR